MRSLSNEIVERKIHHTPILPQIRNYFALNESLGRGALKSLKVNNIKRRLPNIEFFLYIPLRPK
jgi:hypothetical protein